MLFTILVKVWSKKANIVPNIEKTFQQKTCDD